MPTYTHISQNYQIPGLTSDGFLHYVFEDATVDTRGFGSSPADIEGANGRLIVNGALIADNTAATAAIVAASASNVELVFGDTALASGARGVQIDGADGSLSNAGRIEGTLVEGLAIYGVNFRGVNDGVITGQGTGVFSYAGNVSFTNTGAVFGGYTGLEDYGTGNSFANDGVIRGVNYGVGLHGAGSQLTNTGKVFSSETAVLATVDAQIVNSGFIRGVTGIDYISLGGGALNNSGRLVGLGGTAINGGYASIEVHNTGMIRGDVVLSAVDDLYMAGRGGRVFGDVQGGGGADHLIGNARVDVFQGGAGDDFLNGRSGNDRLIGGSGHNTIYGGRGDDLIDDREGDAGHPLSGPGFGAYDGGAGNDTILTAVGGYAYAGAGNDVIRGDFAAALGEAGRDRIFGGDSMNFLHGGGQNDLLVALDGDDRLYGGAGRDVLRGGAGADLLSGEQGNDVLFGGADADTFYFSRANEGKDVVKDFEDGIDRFDIASYYVLTDGGFASEADFVAAAVSRSGRDAVIDLSVIDGVDKGIIRVEGARGQIDVSDFIFD